MITFDFIVNIIRIHERFYHRWHWQIENAPSKESLRNDNFGSFHDDSIRWQNRSRLEERMGRGWWNIYYEHEKPKQGKNERKVLRLP